MTSTTSGKADASPHRTSAEIDDLHAAVTRRVKALIKANKLRLVNPPGGSGKFMPRCELYEDPTSDLTIATFELPGIQKNEIDLYLRNGFLIVEGERRRPDIGRGRSPSQRRCLDGGQLRSASQHHRSGNTHATSVTSPQSQEAGNADAGTPRDKDPNQQTPMPLYRVQELRFGQFERRVQVPSWVLEKHITAEVLDGMLTVTWPSRPPSQITQSQVDRRALARDDSATQRHN